MPLNFSQYPPAQSDTYIKATTKFDTNYWPYFAIDPTKSLTGAAAANSWAGGSGAPTNQRFHIDLGSAKIIKRIYYENYHNSGLATLYGVKNFTFWGSNTEADFLDLVYANDGTWTQLTIGQSTFDQHVAADQADPKYITVTNTTAYRYYAFKIADDWAAAAPMGIRRIVLQAEIAYVEGSLRFLASLIRKLHGYKNISGSLGLSSTLLRRIHSPRQTGGTLKMSGVLSVLREILYYGPPNP